jgi:hypothetical protein
MYEKDKGQKTNSLQVGTLVDDDAAKIKILSFDFNKAVKDTELNHSDFFCRTNDIVKPFDLAINDTNLPEFNADEKGVIANCLTRSIFNEIFIQSLDYEISDYFKHCPDNFASLDKTALLKQKNALILKVRNLDLMQRIKLINMVYLDFFKTR